jgi:murein DD-endopeptidase MepM/ murein hydrolase activator NlpD
MKPSLLLVFSALCLTACWTPTGTQKPAQIVNYGATSGAGSVGVHTILKGDTVYTVSQRYKLPLRDIIALNDLSPPYDLDLGFRLKLPPPNDYKVRAGDNLNGVSKLFNVSVSEVARLNNLSAPYQIKTGQVLRLPTRQPQLNAQLTAPAAPLGAVERVPLSDSIMGNNDMGDQTSVPVKLGSVQAESLPPPPTQIGGNAPLSPPPVAGVQPAATTTAVDIAPKTPARSGSGRFMRPVDGKVISKFGPKEGGLHNDGINIKAPRGTPVRAGENGVVVYAGNELQGYGNLVLIRHANRYMTAYAHLDKILVKKNDVVKIGQSIGTVGSTGSVDSPQLHFEVRRGTEALNPDLYL